MANGIGALSQIQTKFISNNQWKVQLNSKGLISSITDLKGNKLFGKIGIWLEAETSDNKKFHSVSFLNKNILHSSGPIDLVKQKSSDSNKWNLVNAINIIEAQNHIKNYYKKDYITPENIKNWPANGTKNESLVLAPFVDFGNDGKYEHEKGDYPFFKGTHALYSIGNGVDIDDSKSGLTGYNSSGIELHLMLYKDTTIKNIEDVFFARLLIFNRSGRNYTTFKTALMVEFEVGDDSDDYCGTLRNRNTILAYNSDKSDKEYGSIIPTAFLKILNKEMKYSMYINSPDNAASNWPVQLQGLSNFMSGKWNNGSKITFGGAGIDGNLNENFVFPGNTSNLNSGLWDESIAGLSPSKRTMIIGLPNAVLLKDSAWNVEFAFGGKYDVVDPYKGLESALTAVSHYYGKNSVGFNASIRNQINFYPNPVNDYIVINNLPLNTNFVVITDLTGKEVFRAQNLTSKNIGLQFLNSGVFIISFRSADNTILLKQMLVKME